MVHSRIRWANRDVGDQGIDISLLTFSDYFNGFSVSAVANKPHAPIGTRGGADIIAETHALHSANDEHAGASRCYVIDDVTGLLSA